MENEEISAFFNKKFPQLNDASNNNKDSLIKIKYQDSLEHRNRPDVMKLFSWIKPYMKNIISSILNISED
jgi:hypothetical protein